MITVRPIQPNQHEIDEVATVLHSGFADRSPAWPTVADARAEVVEYSTASQVSLVAELEHQIVGWISATPQYKQYGWELHPIVVAPQYQRRGVGTALINHLCDALQSRQATVLYAWSDDETMSTSLGGVNLYQQPLQHLSSFHPSSRHAGGFYLAQQFVLCGVIPDANGTGKPDILFARHIT